MSHFFIFLNIFSLITGTWAVFYSIQFYRPFKLAFIRFFAGYIIFFNLDILRGLIIYYIKVNVFNPEITSFNLPFSFLSLFIKFIISAGTLYCFLMLILHIQEIPEKKSFKIWIITGIVFMLIIHLMEFLFLAEISPFMNFAFILQLNNYFTSFIFSVLLIELLFRQRMRLRKESGKNSAVNVLGVFYLTMYMTPFFANFIPENILTYIAVILFIVVNFFPVIWFRFFFRKFYITNLSAAGGSIIPEDIYSIYKISARERDIIELLIQGRSNKEIQDKLFISFHTVKNHIYNIYQKLGIKNRGQLLQFINKAENGDN